MPLTSDELQRYARHVVLPQVGSDGQERLRAASVLIIGLGGLGSPAALYLAAAGVGRLGLLDGDTVAVHNLQRQVLHDTVSVGEAKTQSARVRVEALNPHVRVETWQTMLTRENARGILSDYDVVIDGTDSFATRYLINDACVLERRSLVQASVHRFEGQLSVFATAHGPCYRCLHPEPPPAGSVPNCAEGGVLGVLPGLLGTLQATEALKLLLGIGTSMAGRLLVVDALTMRFHEVGIERDPACAWCATRTATALLDDYAAFCGESPATVATTSGSATAAITADTPTEIAPAALAVRLARGDALRVIDVREPWEHQIAHLESATLVPMQTIPSAHHAWDRHAEYVVYCHHGMRSGMVADYLRATGFTRVLNLEGGIDRWSVEVDPSVARY
ncbi:MAG: molybdopterin-synthase adenylyltransferase MoeB [Gemmatimonadaceae bacterium]|nr:molybdopterin-synthase adenylyltransferase MoeB [Gemmatimonadaceae bacterium]